MLLIGELKEPRFNFLDSSYEITICCKEIPQEVNGLVDKKVKCELKKFSAARSLNANALFHLIVGIIANNIGASSTVVKNQLLCDYGQLDDGKSVLIRSDIDTNNLEDIHLKPTGELVEHNGQTYAECLVVRGSHTYDSKEMSTLIQGAKDELSELGISMPISEEEVSRILGRWRSD